MIRHDNAITLKTESFSHQDACQIHQAAFRIGGVNLVLIDLSQVKDATTSAFARLVILRKALLHCGRDLRLVGLRGRAALIYEINRLTMVLPQV